jgi:hypothetical protein
LTEGRRKSLSHISFGAFEEDFPRFRERLEAMGIDLLDPPRGFESNGLWFCDCDGMQMAAKGYTSGWGLGRHVLGSNYFHYVRDPWGSYCEYASDIDYIPADVDWRSGDHPPEDSFYVWVPEPPKDFAVNYEATR